MQAQSFPLPLRLEGALVLSRTPILQNQTRQGLESASDVCLDVSGATEIDLRFLQFLIARRKTAKAGYAVVEAGDRVGGLDKAQTNGCQIVLIDVSTPNMIGLTYIRDVRKLAASQGVPILFLTTEADNAITQEARAAGATGTITKSSNPEQLTAVAKNCSADESIRSR